MIIEMPNTRTREISQKIDELHEERGESATGRVLTLLISTTEDELEQAVRFVERLDIRSIAERVMHTLFQALAMRYDFSLQDIEAPLISETEETT